MAYVVLMLTDGTIVCGDSGPHDADDIARNAGKDDVILVLTNGWIIDDGSGDDPTRCAKPIRLQMSCVLSVDLMRRPSSA